MLIVIIIISKIFNHQIDSVVGKHQNFVQWNNVLVICLFRSIIVIDEKDETSRRKGNNNRVHFPVQEGKKTKQS